MSPQSAHDKIAVCLLMPPSGDVCASTDLSHSSGMRPITPPAESPLPAFSHEDNTAAGMALIQEDSMYITPASSPVYDEKDGDIKQLHPIVALPTDLHTHHVPVVVDGTAQPAMHVDPPIQLPSPAPSASTSTSRTGSEIWPKVDAELNRSSTTRAWDFSSSRPQMRAPSALFQPYSRFIGTQQSDRHTYTVEVTILTIDMPQSQVSGYLTINGLTKEHPTLQTFFTGQIVGGPNHRYTFKTTDPSWGATEKVDLQHWLRFPPWRNLSAHAKRDMKFDFPLDGSPWWTQEHVYMRWKEHFLVPDHKESNITGASFEGFYYICLNLWEGKISGVYFHSKSERYV